MEESIQSTTGKLHPKEHMKCHLYWTVLVGLLFC